MEAWQNIADVKLRNAHLAVVERQKLVDYLLNASHPDNGGKAQFFASLGFHAGDAEPLVAALQGVASEGEMVASAHSVHGEKHVVEGWLVAHTGTGRRAVRTVWIVDAGSEAPRLVTAYPGKE